MTRLLPLPVALLTVAAAFSAAADPVPVGVNLAGNTYWTEEVAFRDRSLHFKELHPQQRGAGFAEHVEGATAFGPDGYPTSLRDDHEATTLWDMPVGAAPGRYALLWNGTGEVRWSGAGRDEVLDRSKGRIDLWLDSPEGRSSRKMITIRSIDPADPLRDLRLVRLAESDGNPANLAREPFEERFLRRWEAMSVFRYMNWGGTNNSELSRWADRPRPGDFTQAHRGIALELQVDHANTAGAHPWFCVPHLADDGFVREMATLIRDRLDPGLVARVELSNEVWNQAFSQGRHALERGNEEIAGQYPFQNLLHWYSRRAGEVHAIFTDVFTRGGTDPSGRQRLKLILGGQAANTYSGGEVLDFEDGWRRTDAMAIAPYFGGGIGAGEDAEALKAAGFKEMAALIRRELQKTLDGIDKQAALVRRYDQRRADAGLPPLELVAYEGGQHFQGHPDTWNDDALTQKLFELNRHPAMEQAYVDYLNHWESVGGGEFVLFESLSEFSKYGSWGLLEHIGQPIAETPKLRGVYRYLGVEPPAPVEPRAEPAPEPKREAQPAEPEPEPKPKPQPEPEPQASPAPEPGPEPRTQPDPRPRAAAPSASEPAAPPRSGSGRVAGGGASTGGASAPAASAAPEPEAAAVAAATPEPLAEAAGTGTEEQKKPLRVQRTPSAAAVPSTQSDEPPALNTDDPLVLAASELEDPEQSAWAPGSGRFAGHLVAGGTDGEHRIGFPLWVEEAGVYELWVQRRPAYKPADFFLDGRPPTKIGRDRGEGRHRGGGPVWHRIGEVELPEGEAAVVVVARAEGYAFTALRLGERPTRRPGRGGRRIAFD